MNYIYISIITFFIIYFIWLGSANDNIKYGVTVGKIIKKNVSVISETNVTKKINGIKLYTNKFKYKLDITYSYKINDVQYTSHHNTKYVDRYDLDKILDDIQINKKIKIYYDKNNHGDCGISINQIKQNKTKYYYTISLLILLILIFYIVIAMY